MITGTWDDHDYGLNDGDKTFQSRDLSKEIWLDFIGEPKTSDRWKHPGVYHSLQFGPVGRRVNLILLDVRYFRDDKHEPNGDTLGTT
jgi:alkaline phosphatase D